MFGTTGKTLRKELGEEHCDMLAWMLYDEIVNALDAHDHEEDSRLQSVGSGDFAGSFE